MAELMVRDGTWTFDDEVVRIVPGRERGVHKLRQDLGEFTVPLAAMAGIAYEPARKGGRLRLRLRDGADPLLQVTGGGLPDEASPYQVAVDAARVDVAEYFVDAVRQALMLEQIPDGPVDRYLLPGPSVPLSAAGVDGIASFDGERVQLEWRWNTSETKRHWGPRDFALADLEAVEWRAAAGLESGYLRFRTRGSDRAVRTGERPQLHRAVGLQEGERHDRAAGGRRRGTAAASLGRPGQDPHAGHPGRGGARPARARGVRAAGGRGKRRRRRRP